MQDLPVTGKKERVMTIEYETNLFGLRGPRKMTAYAGQGVFSSPLNEVFEKEKPYKKKTVHRYRNKIPKWCD
jgi:hypothetical protein